MSALEQRAPSMTADEYLAFEREAEFKHEFVGGQIYSMAGASRKHGLISGDVFADVKRHLRGKPCEAFINDMKVHIIPGSDEIFYYPDIVVTCDERDRTTAHHIAHPKLVIEVLSPTTDRIDRREKLFAYMQIPELEEYVLIEQDFPEAKIYRRADKWKPETTTEHLTLRSIDLTINLQTLFEAIKEA